MYFILAVIRFMIKTVQIINLIVVSFEYYFIFYDDKILVLFQKLGLKRNFSNDG